MNVKFTLTRTLIGWFIPASQSRRRTRSRFDYFKRKATRTKGRNTLKIQQTVYRIYKRFRIISIQK